MAGARKATFIALVAAEVVAQYVRISFAKDFLGALAMVCWVMALGPSDRTSRRISLALIAVGSYLFVVSGASWRQALQSFCENTNVLMVMVLIPLLGVVVDLGGYADALSVVSGEVTKPLTLYVLSMVLAYAIGSVLLNASIALIWVVLYPVAARTRDDPQWFLVKCLPRGYDASLLWTPASPSTAVALGVTGAVWGKIAGPGLAMSLAMLAIAVLLEVGYLRRPPKGANAPASATACEGPVQTTSGSLGTAAQGREARAAGSPVLCEMSADPRSPSDQERRAAVLKVMALGAGVLSFIVSIVTLESFGVTIYQAVLPCVLATTLTWGALIRRGPETVAGLARRLSSSVPGMSNQFLLMTTAGFIGTSVKMATAKGLGAYLSGIASNPTLFALLVSSAVVVLSVLGIHPQIGMVIVYSIVSSAAGRYPPEFAALALMLGAALGYNVSPVSATMLVTSSCAKTNTIGVGVKRHWKHALVVLPIGSLILQALVRAQ